MSEAAAVPSLARVESAAAVIVTIWGVYVLGKAGLAAIF